MKTDEQRMARELRAGGWSVREIARHLSVSQSSVSLWVRDVLLSPDQRTALDNRVTEGRLASNARIRARARHKRREHQEEGRRLVRERDPSYAAGCMLYWAEGDKCRNSVRISNSDPALLRFFADFLRVEFNVDDAAFRVYCNLFADHLERQREIEDFWLAAVSAPRASLRKTVVNTYSKYSQKKRVNRLPYGTCKIAVHSTRIVQTIYGSIQEYGGFERPEWLD